MKIEQTQLTAAELARLTEIAESIMPLSVIRGWTEGKLVPDFMRKQLEERGIPAEAVLRPGWLSNGPSAANRSPHEPPAR